MRGTWRYVGVAVVAWAGSVAWMRAPAQHQGVPAPVASQSASGVAVHVVAEPGHPSQAVIYDADQRSLAVYHIDRGSGAVSLRSVRKVEWDLQLTDFNTSEPLPQDIRSGFHRQP